MDREDDIDKPTPHEDISLDGDVLLVVGSTNTRLKVHSQCLRSASKVFGAMLQPPWREGEDLSKDTPREILLVEDDAKALRTICCVIHHRNDAVPPTIRPKEVLEISIVADKYDFNVALHFARIPWLKRIGNENMLDMGYLMASAFLFCERDAFAAHTLALITHYTGSYLGLLDDALIRQVIPWKTIYLLEERRTRERAEIDQLLIKGKEGSCSCGWGKNRGEAYSSLRLEYTPLKMLETTTSAIVEEMGKVSCDDMKKHSNRCWQYSKTPTQAEMFPAQLSRMEKKASICLDCVRGGDTAITCSFQHEE